MTKETVFTAFSVNQIANSQMIVFSSSFPPYHSSYTCSSLVRKTFAGSGNIHRLQCIKKSFRSQCWAASCRKFARKSRILSQSVAKPTRIVETRWVRLIPWRRWSESDELNIITVTTTSVSYEHSERPILANYWSRLDYQIMVHPSNRKAIIA